MSDCYLECPEVCWSGVEVLIRWSVIGLMLSGCQLDGYSAGGSRALLTVEVSGRSVLESVAAQTVQLGPADGADCAVSVAVVWHESQLFVGEQLSRGQLGSDEMNLQVWLVGEGQRLVGAGSSVSRISDRKLVVHWEEAWVCSSPDWMEDTSETALEESNCEFVGALEFRLKAEDGFPEMCDRAVRDSAGRDSCVLDEPIGSATCE